ncbi:ATP-dependent translocase ABCB1 [Nephila pilipes]|uniref:ABC-type xenobiotic transporter n=1 Tax=Nephila pilipes TaxID=299642 RepID=A0A8X6MF65_NEPPI|nr:ATP-dependent translocase ABCB1 [Nephila pilipes]
MTLWCCVSMFGKVRNHLYVTSTSLKHVITYALPTLLTKNSGSAVKSPNFSSCLKQSAVFFPSRFDINTSSQMVAGEKSNSPRSTKGYRLLENEDSTGCSQVRAIASKIQQSKDDLLHSQETAENHDGNFDLLLSVGYFSLFKYSSLWDKILMVIAVLVALFSGMLWPTISILSGEYLNHFVHHPGINMTNQMSSNFSISEDFLLRPAMLSFHFALLAVIIYVSFYIIMSFFSLSAAHQVYKIRCLFMASILKQEIGWFDIHETGDFASKLTSDLNKIEDGIGEKVGFCISFFSSAILSVACALYYGWELTLVMFSITPVMTVAMALISRAQTALSYEESEAYGAAGAIAEESFSSIRTVVAFGGEMKEIQRYEKCLAPARRKGIKRGLLTSLGIGLTWFCMYFGYAVTFWYGVKLIIEDKDKINPTYTAGTLLIVFSNVLYASMFIGQIAPFFEIFALAKSVAGVIFSVIERKSEIDSSSQLGVRPSKLSGSVTLRNVYFNYPARFDVEVLKGVSLTVKPGETIALVGPSGCGKSTIIQLILRFYDTTEGCIEIDSHNVKDLNVGWLRNNIGFVGQEPVLFSTTIGENIRFGKDDATIEEIKVAAKLANIHEFISTLPKKYNTLVGDRGTQLSGGQKQRIALARAIVKNPKILLLDEATSALDTESEAIVQLALDEARKGRTTIIVAHRLSTVKNADRIFVLSDGVIKEVGNHNELMESKGLYHHLVLSQMFEMDILLDDDIDGGRHILTHRLSALTSSSFTSHGSSQDASGYMFKEFDDKSSVSWMRLLKISIPEWPYLVVGSVAALIMGLHTPLYGVVFGSILGVLSENINKLSDHYTFYCIIFVIMAVTSFTASFLQTFMFSIASEKLTSRLRKEVFSKIITQDITWFDYPANSVGSLCARLTSDASDLQGASGSRISTLVQTVSTLAACTFLACYFNYKLGSLVFAFVPLILMAAYFGKRFTVGDILSDKSSFEMASKIAVEAIGSIRTVASLHQEEGFYRRYTDALVLPYRHAKKASRVKGIIFAFSQSIQVFAYATTYYYGSVLIARGELTYSDMYKAIEGILVSVIVLGHLFAFAPDFQKAVIAAANIFKILDMKSGIDVFSLDGRSLVETDVNNEDLAEEITSPTQEIEQKRIPSITIDEALNMASLMDKICTILGARIMARMNQKQIKIISITNRLRPDRNTRRNRKAGTKPRTRKCTEKQTHKR